MKERWGVIEDGVFRKIERGPLEAAGWVTDHFWMERPDGMVLFILQEPLPESAFPAAPMCEHTQ